MNMPAIDVRSWQLLVRSPKHPSRLEESFERYSKRSPVGGRMGWTILRRGSRQAASTPNRRKSRANGWDWINSRGDT